MHFGWQDIVVAVIVAFATWHVARVIWGQVAGFRKAAKAGTSGCGSCETGAKKAASPQLITLSAAPLRRVVVPKAEEAPRNEP